MNNLKQSGLGILSYTDDHKEFLFYLNDLQWNMLLNREAFVAYSSTLSKTWKSGNYVQNRSAMMCPAIFPFVPQKSGFKVNKTDGSGLSDSIGRHVSTYGFICQADVIQRDKVMDSDSYKAWYKKFWAGLDKTGTTQAGHSWRPQFVHNPSRYFFLGDSINVNTATSWYWITFGANKNIAYAPHNSRMNALWADGHADSNGQGDLSNKLHNAPRKVWLDSQMYADF